MKLRIVVFVFVCLARFAHAETVFLVGDSTVSSYAPPDPRQGWGQVIGQFFAPEVAVKNFALSGRSSKSFIEEGAWAPVAAAIQPGDYVFIQFGHNDQKRDQRGTDAFGSYQEFLARYVEDTQKAGGIPVLVTPVGRGGMKNSSGPGSHGRYPQAMLELAQTRKLLAIDLTALSEAHFRQLGFSATLKLFLASQDGKDDTHFLPAGAQEIARLVARAIQDLDTPLAKKVRGLE